MDHSFDAEGAPGQPGPLAGRPHSDHLRISTRWRGKLLASLAAAPAHLLLPEASSVPVARAAPDTASILQPESTPPLAPGDPGYMITLKQGMNGLLQVALTFDADAGDGSSYGGGILDIASEMGVPLTFGLTGIWATENPDLVQRMVAEGHQLMNHTWNHASFTGYASGMPPMTFDNVAWQMNQTEQAVLDIAGYGMKPWFRPPFGDIDDTTSGYLYQLGYYLNLMWTRDSQGWAGWLPEEIVQHCTEAPSPGEVILMHTGSPGDYQALPGTIDAYISQGYTFVTAAQMFG